MLEAYASSERRICRRPTLLSFVAFIWFVLGSEINAGFLNRKPRMREGNAWRSLCFLKLWILVSIIWSNSPAADASLQMEMFMGLKRPVVCVCIDAAEPVCGVDWKTYPSKCMAACRNVEVRAQGPCNPGRGYSQIGSSSTV